MMHLTYIGIGTNIRPIYHARLVVERLRDHYGDVRVSRVYHAAPAHGHGPPFVNAAAAVATTETPDTVAFRLEGIEDDLGRRRTRDRNAPRTIDLDILAARHRGRMRLHPDVRRYAHALVPLLDLAPDLEDHDGTPVRDLLHRIPSQDLRVIRQRLQPRKREPPSQIPSFANPGSLTPWHESSNCTTRTPSS